MIVKFSQNNKIEIYEYNLWTVWILNSLNSKEIKPINLNKSLVLLYSISFFHFHKFVHIKSPLIIKMLILLFEQMF